MAKCKIMVVDDERDLSLLIKINLEKSGYDVVTVNNSREVLARAKEEKPGIITLDIMMPQMDGFQVLKLIKSDPETKDIPVVLVSVVSQLFKDQIFRLGAVDFVTKPIDFSRLQEIIEKVFTTKEYKSDKEKKRILVVDDEPDITRLIGNVLKNKGFEVVAANSGVAALDHLKNQKVDLILLDLYMPEMDGFTAIKKIKTDRANADIPIVVLTGNDMKGYREKCLFLGASSYMTKPFSEEILVSEIKTQLRKIEK